MVGGGENSGPVLSCIMELYSYPCRVHYYFSVDLLFVLFLCYDTMWALYQHVTSRYVYFLCCDVTVCLLCALYVYVHHDIIAQE